MMIQAEAQRRRRAYQDHTKRARTNSIGSPRREEQEHDSEGRQAASRYRHRDHYPEPRSTEDSLRGELQEQKEINENLRKEVEKLTRKLGKRSGAASERRKLRKLIKSIQRSTQDSSSGSSSDSTNESNENDSDKKEKDDCAERNPKEGGML